MSWTWEQEGRLSALDVAVLEYMGRPGIAEHNAKIERTRQALEALFRAAGQEKAMTVVATALVNGPAVQATDDRRWAETEQWVDKLSDDLALSDSQYLSAWFRARGLANHLISLSPFLLAAFAVDQEARRGNEVR